MMGMVILILIVIGIQKKKRFKDNYVEGDTSMAVDPDPQLTISWKDKLLGGHTVVSDSDRSVLSAKCDNDFELLERDVNTTIIDGVPAIALSDHIKDIFFREIELTIIVKLLGRKSVTTSCIIALFFFGNQ
ncbi:hypothetical protein Goshw_001938 [Gossypium schwendimanii]|uniref:Uncharacterized protein n=1 Tax=Gossypium schwendimanii TaxID=34291 RepID=A0A7J9MQM8_GOSSC|nr:hypothetical protein [Gossypium schwendimanii]